MDREIHTDRKNAGAAGIKRGLCRLLWLLLILSLFATGAFADGKATTSSGRKVRIAIVDADAKEPWKILRALVASGAKCKATIVTHYKDLKPEKFDGLILPGGGDINPARYHEKNKKGLSKNISNASDNIQFAAFRRFREAGKPILGICKGMQLINVACGGTLYQNIGYGDHYRGSKKKISVSKESAFSYYRTHNRVVHWHHQAIHELGDDLVATMWESSKGKRKKRIIEGIEGTVEAIYGVQWHPDLMGAAGYPFFRKFISICREWN